MHLLSKQKAQKSDNSENSLILSMLSSVLLLILCLLASSKAQRSSECFGEPEEQFQFDLFDNILISSGGAEGEADIFCQNFASGSKLASIRNSEENNIAIDLFRSSASLVAWIGLFDDDTSGLEGSDTGRFKYIDGFEDTSFFEEQGELPWRSFQPFSNQQRCVVLQANSWSEQLCSNSRNVLCRTPCGNLEDEDGSGILISLGFMLAFCIISLLCLLFLIYNNYRQISIIEKAQLNLEGEALGSTFL